jgi:hypothetical protein
MSRHARWTGWLIAVAVASVVAALAMADVMPSDRWAEGDPTSPPSFKTLMVGLLWLGAALLAALAGLVGIGGVLAQHRRRASQR